MTVSYVPPERSWGELIAHVLLRIVLVLAGYFVSVFVTLIAVVILYIALSNLPGAPSYFGAMTVTPIIALLAPWVGLLIYLVAVVLSCVPALVLALITEGLKLRSIFLHMLIGALVSAAAFAFGVPSLEDNGLATGWHDTLIMAGGGLFGGIAYWLIAGRLAGFKPDKPQWPGQVPLPQARQPAA